MATFEADLDRLGRSSRRWPLFGVFFVTLAGRPFDVYYQMHRVAAARCSSSVQNTLLRAAPLLLTALHGSPGAARSDRDRRRGAVVMGGSPRPARRSCARCSPSIVLTGMLLVGLCGWGGRGSPSPACCVSTAESPRPSAVCSCLHRDRSLSHLVEGCCAIRRASTAPLPAHRMETCALDPRDGGSLGLVYGLVACLICYVLQSITQCSASSCHRGQPSARAVVGSRGHEDDSDLCFHVAALPE